jgi:hypothetical protein
LKTVKSIAEAEGAHTPNAQSATAERRVRSFMMEFLHPRRTDAVWLNSYQDGCLLDKPILFRIHKSVALETEATGPS